MKAPLLEKIATYRDESTNLYTEQYRFRKKDTSLSKVEVRPSEAGDLIKFRRQLEDRYALLPSGETCRHFLAEAVKKDAENCYVFAARTGWRKGFRGFVLPSKLVGISKLAIVGVKPPASSNRYLDKVSNKGTVASWRTDVSERAADSSILVTALSAAFAAPLLRLCNQQSFGLCFSGPSRTGKSTATLLAASVIGIPSKSALPTWSTTDAALYERLPYYNDRLFPIDDLMTLKGNNASKFERVRNLAYQLYAGQEMARFSATQERASGTWRSILITSGEDTLSRIAEKAGEVRYNGETLRLIDIPVLHNGKDIFDLTKKNRTQVWQRKIFIALDAACRANHGRVFEKYLAELVKMENKRKFINARRSFFKNKCKIQSSQNLVGDIADRFALLYAGGCLAIKFKLVSWTKEHLEKALHQSFLASCSLLQDGSEIRSRGKALTDAFLKNLPHKSAKNALVAKAGGFRSRSGGKPCFIVSRSVFHGIFEGLTQRSFVLDELKRNKRLFPAGQPMWPDGKRRRAYRILVEED